MIFNRKKEDLNNKKKSDAIFEEGERLWENKEYEKAVEYYKKAAELGHTKSMLFLAYAYRFGEGTAENSEKALSWYKKHTPRVTRLQPDASVPCIITKR